MNPEYTPTIEDLQEMEEWYNSTNLNQIWMEQEPPEEGGS